MLGLFPFPFFLLAENVFNSGNFVVDDVFKLTTGEKNSSVTILKVSLLRITHLCDVVKKFFRCHVRLLLVPFPLPRADLRTLGGVYVRFPLPPCHRRPRLSACFRNTP